MKYRIIVVSFLVCVGGIFYFSWLPNPGLETETYLPLWLRNWSNCYFNLRTAIPFVVVGFLLEALVPRLITGLTSNKKNTFGIVNSAIAIVIVCVAEGGQFFILNRHPDFMDVVFGILGSLSGNVLYYLTKTFIQLFSTKNA